MPLISIKSTDGPTPLKQLSWQILLEFFFQVPRYISLKRIRNLLIKFQHCSSQSHFRGWYCICRGIIITTFSVASWDLRILVMFWGCPQQLNECPPVIAVITLSIVLLACPLLPRKDRATQGNGSQVSQTMTHLLLLIWSRPRLCFDMRWSKFAIHFYITMAMDITWEPPFLNEAPKGKILQLNMTISTPTAR